MRKSILVILLVAATVFTMGVPNGYANGGVSVLERLITLPTATVPAPICINTRANYLLNGIFSGPNSTYPFQDTYKIDAVIPLGDFSLLSGLQTVLTAGGIAVFLPFNPVKEFNSLTTITVAVERDPFGAANVYTPVYARPEVTAGSFTVSMGRLKAASTRNTFSFQNAFLNTKNKKDILDNFNVMWTYNDGLKISLTGMRYHNFGDVWDAQIAGTTDVENSPPNNVLVNPAGPYRDIMRTPFDMDTNRGFSTITNFLQNVRITVVTRFTHATYGAVTRTCVFSTSTLDDNLVLGADDLLLNGWWDAPGGTVAGCLGDVFTIEREKVKGAAELVPTTAPALPVTAAQ